MSNTKPYVQMLDDSKDDEGAARGGPDHYSTEEGAISQLDSQREASEALKGAKASGGIGGHLQIRMISSSDDNPSELLTEA